MLRIVTDADCPPPAAYRVPWRIEHIYDAHPLVVNDSTAAADFVRVFVASPSSTIAWFRPEDGAEYVWRFAP